MRKLYEKHGLLFALAWILAYCLVMAPLKEDLDVHSIWTLLALLAFAAGITVFVKAGGLEKSCGLTGWPRDTKRLLYFIPMWILATGNLWDGFAPYCQGAALLIAALSMVLVGYVEEMLFRGLLFKAILKDGKPAAAIVISAVTFGIGHIVNLFAGQASYETLLQIVFAISWGFILTLVFYKCGSLLPCIAAHAMIDVFSVFGADNVLIDYICIGLTVVGGAAYCLYLSRQKTAETK